MSQQSLDLRESLQIVRRHKMLVGIFIIVGLLGGCAYVLANPPTMTSQAVVAVQGTSASAMSTDVVVAGSDPVLAGALPHISPQISLADLRLQVQVTSLTSSLIQVTGMSTSAATAESIANGVANSFITYVGSSSSPIGDVSAKVFEAANTANGAGLPGRVLSFGLFGLIGGLLLGSVVAIAKSRGDRKLRHRGEIANSIGVPVVAAISVSHPTDSGGWTHLLNTYEPRAVDAWRLRQTIDRLGVSDAHGTREGARHSPVTGPSSSVTVLSLSSDPGALALGPQLASFAASLGIRTALVLGPQQDASTAATLRTACAVPASESLMRSRPLRVAAVGGDLQDSLPIDASLVVVVVVVDSARPQMPGAMRTANTLLGVTAGAVTAEEMARAATTAAGVGREIVGIMVADPDPTDQTSGSVPQLGQPTRRRIPTRLTGIPTETRR